MAKREYKGPAIDLTDLPGESHIGEKDGETVAGTTDDDLNDEETEAWPSALDKENFSPTETEVVKTLCLHPKASYNAVAESVGCSHALVYHARQKIKEAGKVDEVPFDVTRSQDHGQEQPRQEKTEETDVSAKEWFIEAMSDDPGASMSEIAGKMPEGKDWHKQNYHNVMRSGRGRAKLKRKIIKKGNWDNADGAIREKLENVDVDVEERNESSAAESDVESTGESGHEDREAELEKAIVELSRELAQANSMSILPGVLSEMDDEDVVSAVLTVINDE